MAFKVTHDLSCIINATVDGIKYSIPPGDDGITFEDPELIAKIAFDFNSYAINKATFNIVNLDELSPATEFVPAGDDE